MSHRQGRELERSRDRRRKVRMPAAHPVAVSDRGGRLLLRGRCADISESGVFCMTAARFGLRVRGEVILDITLPALTRRPPRSNPTRRVRYAGRVVRTHVIGQFVGLGIELTGKLG